MDPALFPTVPQEHPALSSWGQALMGVTWFFTAIAIQTVALRFYLRRKFHQTGGLDDWVMLLALVFHLVFQAFLTLSCVSGLGRPLMSMTFQELADLTKWSWCTTPGSILANTFSRISIAIVLVQIFGMRKWFKHLMIVFTAILTIFGLINFVFVWVQARPVQALWDVTVPAEYHMTPLPQKILTGFLMILFAISDLVYALFSVLFIWKLNMTPRKKMGLVLLMAGSVVTMALAVGRVILVFWSTDIGADSDRVFVFFSVGSLLASIEQCLVIILGSVPKLRVITKLNFPKPSTFNSSLNSFINKFRSSRQSSAASDTEPTWAYSDVELSRGAKSDLTGYPGGQCDPTVKVGYASSGEENREESGIRVTEGYSVTYNGSYEPKTYV